MIYSVRLYTFDPAYTALFLAVFRIGGLWTDTARLQTGHIHTDLLRDPSDSTKFLSIEFWASIGALVAARRSFEVRSFLGWLDRQGIEYEGLGMFVFPAQWSADLDEVSCAVADLAGMDAVRELHSAETEVRP